MPIPQTSAQPSSNNSIGMEKADESHCDCTNTSMNANDNTMATLNNLSMCQNKDEVSKDANTSYVLIDLKQNSKNLQSVVEEEQGGDEEVVVRHASRSRHVSEEDKNNQSVLQQSPKMPRTLAPLEIASIKYKNRAFNNDQQKINDEEQQLSAKKLDNPLIDSIHLSKIPSSKMELPKMVQVAGDEAKYTRKLSEQKLSCKICLDEQGPFITPCKCAGSCSYVHEKCLKDWILQQQKNKKKVQNVDNNGNKEIILFQTNLPEAKCEICQYKYQYQTIFKTKFSLDCFKKCDQSTQSFSTGFIGSLLTCFMIFLIVVMFTNSPFQTTSSENSSNKPNSQEQYQSAPTNNNGENKNSDSGDDGDNKELLQYIFISLSFVILVAFLAITINCCKKALWLRKVVSWKILGFGQQPEQQNFEIKSNTVVPASVITQTQINTARNIPRVYQQTQVRSNAARFLNHSQAQRHLQNNIIPFVPQQVAAAAPPQQNRIVVTQQAMRTTRN